MERWEIIERWVLVTAAAGMCAISGWLALTRGIPLKWAGLFLVPCAFWALWQAFYEDRVNQNVPASRMERIFAVCWLWLRRLVIGAIALMFACMAGAMMLSAQSASDWFVAFAILGVAVFIGRVAWFGAGKNKSTGDDVREHERRKKRYGWRI